MKNITTILLLLIGAFTVNAQKGITTFGIQVKPIIPSQYFSDEGFHIENDIYEVDVEQKLGHVFGMVIRKGITNKISFETGINYISRSFALNFNDVDSNYSEQLDFRFVGYSIPIQGLFYIRLGKKVYMNGSLGISLDMYPTDVENLARDFIHRSFRRRQFQNSLLANLGWEYRTKDKGYFYIGASFQNPIGVVAYSAFRYTKDLIPTDLSDQINGTYLTLDLRYFFNETPSKKGK